MASYPLQKFDSDTERKFAVLLERDADKWLKPAKGQFQMFYKLGAEQPEYVPDFVARALDGATPFSQPIQEFIPQEAPGQRLGALLGQALSHGRA